MIVKLNRQDCISKFKTFPLREYNAKENEFTEYAPKTFANYRLTISAKSYVSHFKLLGTEVMNMTIHLGENDLIFLGDLEIPWLSQDHEFKRAKEGLEYLVENKVGKQFKGALKVDTTQLDTFVNHLAWLIRLNAIAPYVHFIDPKQRLIGSICQYGNLHLSTTNKKADDIVKKAIAKTRLEYYPDGPCDDKYLKTSAIPGRKWVE